MPLIEVEVFEQELTKKQTDELIAKMTDAMTPVTHEKLRDVTWVIVRELRRGNWGVGGKALGLEDVRKMIGG